jgi:hypothetical protein
MKIAITITPAEGAAATRAGKQRTPPPTVALQTLS